MRTGSVGWAKARSSRRARGMPKGRARGACHPPPRRWSQSHLCRHARSAGVVRRRRRTTERTFAAACRLQRRRLCRRNAAVAAACRGRRRALPGRVGSCIIAGSASKPTTPSGILAAQGGRAGQRGPVDAGQPVFLRARGAAELSHCLCVVRTRQDNGQAEAQMCRDAALQSLTETRSCAMRSGWSGNCASVWPRPLNQVPAGSNRGIVVGKSRQAGRKWGHGTLVPSDVVPVLLPILSCVRLKSLMML